jgi:hypothetical protein
VTQGPSLETDDFEITVPPGLTQDELPSPVTIATKAVSYNSESKFEHDVLRYERQYKVQTFGVPLAGLVELNRRSRRSARTSGAARCSSETADGASRRPARIAAPAGLFLPYP